MEVTSSWTRSLGCSILSLKINNVDPLYEFSILSLDLNLHSTFNIDDCLALEVRDIICKPNEYISCGKFLSRISPINNIGASSSVFDASSSFASQLLNPPVGDSPSQNLTISPREAYTFVFKISPNSNNLAEFDCVNISNIIMTSSSARLGYSESQTMSAMSIPVAWLGSSAHASNLDVIYIGPRSIPVLSSVRGDFLITNKTSDSKNIKLVCKDSREPANACPRGVSNNALIFHECLSRVRMLPGGQSVTMSTRMIACDTGIVSIKGVVLEEHSDYKNSQNIVCHRFNDLGFISVYESTSASIGDGK